MITKLFNAITKTLFPPVCNVCGSKLHDYENMICDNCMVDIPLTNNWHVPHNIIYDRLREKVSLESAITLFHYTTEDRYSNIILNLKFRNQRRLAYEMGAVMGRYIRNSEAVKDVDYIIAVPLHVSRRRWRGYNQSDYIARGLSDVLGIDVLKGVVVRYRKSKVQSKVRGIKGREDNVRDIFRIDDVDILRGKRVMLVDDVITSGATMASCGNILVKNCKVKLIAVALSSTK